MQKLGKKDGAVMSISLEISKIQAVAEPLKIWDLQNPDLGVVGYRRIEANIGTIQNPVVVRLPFYIRINTNGVLEFEALNVEENFNDTPVEIKMYSLIAPEISINVNGKTYKMNEKQLDQTFYDNLPAILKMLRNYLSDFARIDLPKTLNTKAKEYLSGSIEQIQNMEPAGKDPKDTRPDFKWGLKMNSLNLANSLDIHFNAFIEDYYRNPKQPVVPPAPVPTSGSRGAPAMNNLPMANYDLALAVDRGLINRVLQLSYLRGNFSQVSQSDGSTLKLRAAPVVDYAPVTANWPTASDEAYLKFRVTVETEPNSNWLDDTIVISFDIIAKLKQSSDKSGLEIVLIDIDTRTLYMDDQYYSWIGQFVKGKVLDGIRDQLREKSKNWKLGKEKIPGKLDLPPTLLGIKLDLTKTVMDPNGHLVLYTNYANENFKATAVSNVRAGVK